MMTKKKETMQIGINLETIGYNPERVAKMRKGFKSLNKYATQAIEFYWRIRELEVEDIYSEYGINKDDLSELKAMGIGKRGISLPVFNALLKDNEPTCLDKIEEMHDTTRYILIDLIANHDIVKA